MNGIILINKPEGCTSHDIVYKVKRKFKEKVRSYWNFRSNGNRSTAYTNGKSNQMLKIPNKP